MYLCIFVEDPGIPREGVDATCACWLVFAARCAAAMAAALLAALSSRICADALHREGTIMFEHFLAAGALY